VKIRSSFDCSDKQPQNAKNSAGLTIWFRWFTWTGASELGGPHNFTGGRGGQKGFKWNDFEL